MGRGAYGRGPILTQQVWLEHDGDEPGCATRSTVIWAVAHIEKDLTDLGLLL